ncbi:MAG TPA: hypothetical protein VFY25_04735 [Anaerolineales bacterium]|nr:hypothetical protein [Anaerolineales bacterium]
MVQNKEVFETKWAEFRWNTLNWRNKRRIDQLSKVSEARERAINILQKRYGYTREQAIYQLDEHYSGARLG